MFNRQINPKQNNTRGVKIVAQCYSIVKIPCAEQGDGDYKTRTKNK